MEYKQIKSTLKKLAIAYAVASGFYMLGETVNRNITGHPSADLYTGKCHYVASCQPTRLERIMLGLVDKLVEVDLTSKLKKE